MKARNITSTDIILLQCLGNFFFFFLISQISLQEGYPQDLLQNVPINI